MTYRAIEVNGQKYWWLVGKVNIVIRKDDPDDGGMGDRVALVNKYTVAEADNLAEVSITPEIIRQIILERVQ